MSQNRYYPYKGESFIYGKIEVLLRIKHLFRFIFVDIMKAIWQKYCLFAIIPIHLTVQLTWRRSYLIHCFTNLFTFLSISFKMTLHQKILKYSEYSRHF